jgi:hypothetical protein
LDSFISGLKKNIIFTSSISLINQQTRNPIMATNLISVPIYRINQSQTFEGGAIAWRVFALPATGLMAQPVAHPHNTVNGAQIYSAIKTPATGDAVLYSSKTVAEIITLANA